MERSKIVPFIIIEYINPNIISRINLQKNFGLELQLKESHTKGINYNLYEVVEPKYGRNKNDTTKQNNV